MRKETKNSCMYYGEECQLIENCDQKEKICDKCIKHEIAWQKVQSYIDCHNYDISYEFFEKYYKSYYLPGWYVNDTILDIIKNNEVECKVLFEE